MTAIALASSERPLGRLSSETWVKFAIVVIVTLQFAQIFTRSINWDEFGHYNQIIQLTEGTLPQIFQRAHTFVFAWVTLLPGSNIDHIIVIRVFMFACELISMFAIVAIATRLSNRMVGLLCALAYVSFPYVFQYGASFRYDPPVTAILLGLMWIIVSTNLRLRALLGGAVLVALLPFVTVKSVLYVPAFLGITFWRWTEQGRDWNYVLRLAAMGVIALILCAALYLALGQFLPPRADGTNTAFLARAAGGTFALLDNPNVLHMAHGLARHPVVLAIILLAPISIFRSGRPTAERIALIGLWSPALVPFFYVNTAPYIFIFLLPPVLLAGADVVAAMTERLKPAIIAGLCLVFPLLTLATEPDTVLDQQRMLRSAAEETFPADIAYFDFPGFLGTPGKANMFMSPLVVQNHHEAGELLIEPIMQQRAVPLVIDNHFIIHSALETDSAEFLQAEDLRALRENYVHFWGPFWLAGYDVKAGSEAISLTVNVPGTFTLRGMPMTIDGQLIHPGSTVELSRGSHSVLPSTEGPSQLIWGEDIVPPAYAPPAEPYFVAF